MVETQLCKLRGTSDTFVGRAYSIFHLQYVFCELNKGVVSCNTGGSDETPTLVGTGVPHRQRSQGGAVLTITADGQKGSVSSRISQEEMGTDVEVSGV